MERAKTECDAAQDLLRLHIDGLCSAPANDFIECHLESCEDCKNRLYFMRYERSVSSEKEKSLQRANGVTMITKRVHKDKLKNVLLGILLCCVVLFTVWNTVYLPALLPVRGYVNTDVILATDFFQNETIAVNFKCRAYKDNFGNTGGMYFITELEIAELEVKLQKENQKLTVTRYREGGQFAMSIVDEAGNSAEVRFQGKVGDQNIYCFMSNKIRIERSDEDGGSKEVPFPLFVIMDERIFNDSIPEIYPGIEYECWNALTLLPTYFKNYYGEHYTSYNSILKNNIVTVTKENDIVFRIEVVERSGKQFFKILP